MKVLLDEDVPVPLITLVRHILNGHAVDHVYEVGRKGKSDANVYKDARARGYDVVITNNIRQLSDPDECDAINKSRKHLVLYNMDNGYRAWRWRRERSVLPSGPSWRTLQHATVSTLCGSRALTQARGDMRFPTRLKIRPARTGASEWN